MHMVILIMGLPDSGKSTLAASLSKNLSEFANTKWINADAVRAEFNDWEFSDEARKRQAFRMKGLAHKAISDGAEVVILDFVCPTPEYRAIIDPDVIICMDTKTESVHADTNKVFSVVTENEARKLQAKLYVIKSFAAVSSTISEVSSLVARNLNKGPLAFLAHKDSHVRSILKGTTYRIFGSFATFSISWLFTGSAVTATSITVVEIVSKIFLYYVHERIWNKI